MPAKNSSTAAVSPAQAGMAYSSKIRTPPRAAQLDSGRLPDIAVARLCCSDAGSRCRCARRYRSRSLLAYPKLSKV